MPYCVHCGKQSPQGSHCGCTQPAAPSFSAAPVELHGPRKNTLLSFGETVGGIFSGRVTDAMGLAAAKRDGSWLISLLLSLLAGGLALGSYVNGLVGVVEKAIRTALPYISFSFDFWMSFCVGVLWILVCFVAVWVLSALLLVLARKKINILNITNMVAAAMLPSAAILLLAAVFSLFWPVAAGVLIQCAPMPAMLLVYFGIQRLARFEKSIFWPYVVLFLVYTVIVTLAWSRGFLPVYVNAILEKVEQLVNMFSSLFW